MRTLVVLGWLVLVGLQVANLQATRSTAPDVYQQINAKLAEHDRLLAEWKPVRAVPDSKFLEEFLAGIRHDGFLTHAEEKQRINAIERNLQQISALLEVYSPKKSASTFRQARGDFEKYSAAWSDREDAILGLYLLGGELPHDPLTFPQTLREALAMQSE